MLNIEEHYNKEVKYHNQVHAADVTHSTHFLLCAPALEVGLTQITLHASTPFTLSISRDLEKV